MQGSEEVYGLEVTNYKWQLNPWDWRLPRDSGERPGEISARTFSKWISDAKLGQSRDGLKPDGST